MKAEKETIIDVIFPKEEVNPAASKKTQMKKALVNTLPFIGTFFLVILCFQHLFNFNLILSTFIFLSGSGLILFMATRKELAPRIYKERKGVKRWGVITPCLSILSISLMMWWFGGVGIFIGIFCTISLIGVFIIAASMKRKGRDPSALLATASAKPIIIFVGFCAYILALAYLGRPEYISVQKEYKRNHPGQAFPKDELFGFVIGETSFDEAIAILEAAGSPYKIGHFEDTDIPSLSAKNYKHGKIPFKDVSLEFDGNNNVYFFEGIIDEKALEKGDILDIHRAFNYRFKRRGNEPFRAGRLEYYWTQRGSKITFHPYQDISSISIKNTPLEQEVEGYRNYAKRRAAQKAHEKWLS